MRAVPLLLALFSSLALSAEWSDIGYPLADSLPTELRNYLRTAQAHEPYALAAWVNPYYLRADFNGDGHADVAVLALEHSSGKKGILIVHGETIELLPHSMVML